MCPDRPLTVGSLFAGIGGFDLGFERAGMRTAWFVECDPYCQAVLRKHWPGVPIYDDVCTVDAHNLAPVDLLCGGFPCQDLSAAGKGAGLDGARSGLWTEFARLIGELRPRWVVVENVPVLRSRGLGRVLGEMATLGYDAEWDCIPASAVGAPHRRDRIWIVAYPQREGREGLRPEAGQSQVPESGDSSPPDVAHAEGIGIGAGLREGRAGEERPPRLTEPLPTNGDSRNTRPPEPELGGVANGLPSGLDDSHWLREPEEVPRTAHGVENCGARLKAVGNALVPQVAEWIGRRIVAYEHSADLLAQ